MPAVRLRLIVLAALITAPASAQTAPHPELEEATLRQLADRLSRGEVTSERLVEQYRARIAALDAAGPTLRSVLALNPDAIEIARGLDAERKAGRVRGPLHGLPVLVKDNIDSGDRMSTTAGSLALEGVRAARDAFVLAQLREAGVVLLGKTNLSEWANIRSARSTSGWSALGGLVRNPYALDRSACGSSSGTGAAIAASLAAAGVGSETDGSIVCPASMTALVGLKPTVGRLSRTGVIPISHTQDTLGPMARTVEDAALLFEGMLGDDPEDAAMKGAPKYVAPDLGVASLRGRRLGVVRSRSFALGPDSLVVLDAAVQSLRDAGATVLDPLDAPSFMKIEACETPILLHELKHDLDRKLGALGPDAKVHSLADVITFNRAQAPRELGWFGQELFEKAQALGPLTGPAYLAALKSCRQAARGQGIDRLLKQHRVEALVAISYGPAWVSDVVNGDHFTGGSSSPAAVAGYPSLSVPGGQVHGLPVGLSFFAEAWSEARLLSIGAAYERETHHRRPPTYRAHVGE